MRCIHDPTAIMAPKTSLKEHVDYDEYSDIDFAHTDGGRLEIGDPGTCTS